MKTSSFEGFHLFISAEEEKKGEEEGRKEGKKDREKEFRQAFLKTLQVESERQRVIKLKQGCFTDFLKVDLTEMKDFLQETTFILRVLLTLNVES